MRTFFSKLTLISLGLFIGVIISLLGDYALGYLLPKQYHLTVPDRSASSFKTHEFEIKTSANNLGFRGRDIEIDKSTKFRILLLGDSFTFGWGVSLEQTWAVKLERTLNEEGLDVEVLNLGKAGASPREYVEIAARALPLLKPDLTVVGLLQGNDLSQLVEERRKEIQETRPENEGRAIESYIASLASSLTRIYPNTYQMLFGYNEENPMLVSEIWKFQISELLAGATEAERASYKEIPERYRKHFESGELNPGLISDALKNPKFFTQLLDSKDKEITNALRALRGYLSTIKKEAKKIDSKLLILSIPAAPYTWADSHRSHTAYRYEITYSLLTTDRMDAVYKDVANELNLPLLSVTKSFRENAVKEDLYFLDDGHMNASGHALLATNLSPIVSDILQNYGD